MPLTPCTGDDTLEAGKRCRFEGLQSWGKGLESGKSVKRIRCLYRARRARSRGVVCSSGAVVVVVGVDLLVGSVSLEWVLDKPYVNNRCIRERQGCM